jgi:predicted dehydrogenase
VLAVNATNHGQIPGGWFLDPEASGGGAVMDHTVHVADLLRWMLDVEAGKRLRRGRHLLRRRRIDDAAILTLELEGAPAPSQTVPSPP